MYDENGIMQLPTRVNSDTGILETVQPVIRNAEIDLSQPIINRAPVTEEDVLTRMQLLQTGQSTINVSPVVAEQINIQRAATEVPKLIEAIKMAEAIVAAENPIPVDTSGKITEEGVLVREQNNIKAAEIVEDVLAAQEYFKQKDIQTAKEAIAINIMAAKGEAMATEGGETLGEQAAKQIFKSEADIINLVNEEKRKAEIIVPPNKVIRKKSVVKQLSFLDQIVEFIYNKIY